MSATRPRSDADSFGQQVHDALVHLDDPTRLQVHSLARLAAPDARRPESAGRALRQRLLDAVEALRPARDTPVASEAWRCYEILRLRYVEGLEIADVRERLGISRAEYFREHRRAVDAVASLLRDSLGERGSPGDPAARSHGERGSARDDPRRDNLPAQLTSFVGREQELGEVGRLLAATRLLTLTGTGGCGKTRLALECARTLLDAYPDGVWLVSLAGLADPALVPQAVASVLSVREEPGTPLLDTIARGIGGQRTLIILDNCEHLLEACASLVGALLGACPSLSILATSRQALGILGETVLRVPSLRVPPAEFSPSLDSLATCGSVRLFADRARSVAPYFALSEGNAPAVAAICRRLDGIPLAIELAAARTRVLSPEQIASRLDDDFHLLTGGSRTALPRQQTLKATLDWSYDLLDESEPALLRRLSVFAGGFTLEAAESVCDRDGIEERDVLDLLTSLVDKSLAEVETIEGDGRYRLLEPVRQYAAHRLGEAGETERTRDRHRDWCLTLARSAERGVLGREMIAWLDRLEAEHANLRAALAWCLERDVEAGLEIVGCLGGFWGLHAHYKEGSRWAAQLLQGSASESLQRARALRTACNMAWGENRGDRVAKLGEESVRLCRALGDGRELGRSLVVLAHMLWPHGEHERRERLLTEALQILREVGDGFDVSDALWELGTAAEHRGDLERSRRFLEESLAVARRVGYLDRIAWSLAGLGNLTLGAGDRAQAQTMFEEALEIFRSERQLLGIGGAALFLAHLASLDGQLARANSLAREMLTAARQVGSGIGYDACVELAAELAAQSGDHVRSARLFGAIDGEARRSGHVYEPAFPSVYDEALARTLESLGEEVYARARAEGEAMTLEQAVEYALHGEGDA